MKLIKAIVFAAIYGFACAAGAATFGPNDPKWYFASSTTIVAQYPYKIVVFERPKGVELVNPPNWRKPDMLFKDNQPFPADQLKATKTITYKELISDIYLTRGRDPGDNLLVCSNLLTDPNDQGTKKHRNPSGKISQFCGIVSMNGETVFEFPIKQKVPDRLVSPLLVYANGKKAAIAVGSASYDNADSGYESVSNFREVWIWEFPNKLTKHTGKNLPTTDWRGLRDLLDAGKL